MLPLAIRSELAGKRIFMTGATGLFGRWILSELAEVDLELVLLTRDPDAFTESFPIIRKMQVAFVTGDVRSFDFPIGHFDFIVHAATPVVSDRLSDSELSTVILKGTQRVLDFATQSGCHRLLYVSSGAVYGQQPKDVERVAETSPCKPTSSYGRAKLDAEAICLRSQVDCVIARCFAFVGPSIPLDAHFAIGNFIGNCLRNESIDIKGDGTPLRSYMYASDLVEWLLAILLRGHTSEVYNVGSEVAISIAELAHKVRTILATDDSIEIRSAFSSGQNIQRYVPSHQKAVESLGLEMKVDLECAIRNTVESWRRLNS